jgi:hypothetical protein
MKRTPMPLDPTAPPSILAQTGATLWRSLQTEHDIRDSGGLQTLLQICRAADRAEQCASVIERDGATIETKNGQRDHPLLKHELQNRAYITRTLQRLRWIEIEPPNRVGRPGYGGIGVTYEQLNNR